MLYCDIKHFLKNEFSWLGFHLNGNILIDKNFLNLLNFTNFKFEGYVFFERLGSEHIFLRLDIKTDLLCEISLHLKNRSYFRSSFVNCCRHADATLAWCCLQIERITECKHLFGIAALEIWLKVHYFCQIDACSYSANRACWENKLDLLIWVRHQIWWVVWISYAPIGRKCFSWTSKYYFDGCWVLVQFNTPSCLERDLDVEFESHSGSKGSGLKS